MLQPINVNTIFCGIVIIKLLILYVQIFHSKISIFLVVVFWHEANRFDFKWNFENNKQNFILENYFSFLILLNHTLFKHT